MKNYRLENKTYVVVVYLIKTQAQNDILQAKLS